MKSLQISGKFNQLNCTIISVQVLAWFKPYVRKIPCVLLIYESTLGVAFCLAVSLLICFRHFMADLYESVFTDKIQGLLDRHLFNYHRKYNKLVVTRHILCPFLSVIERLHQCRLLKHSAVGQI